MKLLRTIALGVLVCGPGWATTIILTGTQDLFDTPQVERAAWLLQNQLPLITSQTGGAGIQVWDIMTGNGDGFAAGHCGISPSSGLTVRPLFGDGINDNGPGPAPGSTPMTLVLTGAGLIFLGKPRVRNSGKIESHAERSDIRCEEFAGDARGRALL
jgi:hypothetical protein